MDFSGKVALVTGASRGIGRATALALARGGAQVIVNFQSCESAAEEVVRTIETIGGKGAALRANIGSAPEVESLFERVDRDFGKLDILVNNAGIGLPILLEDLTLDFWNEVLQVDLTGPFLCTKAAARRMIPRRYGRIVNVSSVAAAIGLGIDPSYTAAKAGLLGFTKSTARHLGRHNITVNAVCPGPTNTDLNKNLPEEHRSTVAKSSALGRMGQPEDIADAILFFASDYARHVTGQMICVDGGIAMP